LRFEPGQQLRVTMRLAKQAPVRITPNALLRFDHVTCEPDQIIAENAASRIRSRVCTQLLQRVDHQRRRVGPAPVQRALACARTFSDTLESKPTESDLG